MTTLRVLGDRRYRGREPGAEFEVDWTKEAIDKAVEAGRVERVGNGPKKAPKDKADESAKDN